jgi:ribonucleoside-diphosphate reductase alpha chain
MIEPLKEVLFNVQLILDRKKQGEKLTSVECHDIACHLADAVLSGGIRRAALISLFDFDDEDMLTCKFGNWWENNPQRGRANNSAVILRHKITENEFMNLWAKVEASNAGEPGFIFSNDKDYGTNPCAEIALRPYQFCNLCEINATDVVDQDDFNIRSKVASFLGTLQASYTDFHYLRDVWKKTTEKDALVGVGITGIASGKLDNIDLEEGAKAVKDENERVAKLLGIKKAARTTTVKPSGTSSLVLGSSSGIHAWHDNFYVRRIRVGKNESIYTYLALNHPELVEDDFFNPTQQAIISVPQAAPVGAKTRAESTYAPL